VCARSLSLFLLTHTIHAWCLRRAFAPPLALEPSLSLSICSR
jgi:hypothetical protein